MRWTIHVWTWVLGKDAVDRLGKAFKAVDHGDQTILDASGFQLVHDPEPELGSLGLLDPQPEDILGALQSDADRQMTALLRTVPSSRIFTKRASKKITG